MAISLNKTITRTADNTIDENTVYYDLNTKAHQIVEDVVGKVETELTSAETQINSQIGALQSAEEYATSAASSASSASQIVLGQSTGRANIKPVLNLDFANQKRLDSRVDFTRTSTATYYDGKKMVKAEENLLKYSEDLSNSGWYKGGVTLESGIEAPDGTLTAFNLTESALEETHRIYRLLTLKDTNTASIYLKPNGIQYVKLSFEYNSQEYIHLDCVNQLILEQGNTVSTSNITDIGNGWFRVDITFVGGDISNTRFSISFTTSTLTYNSALAEIYLGDGVSSLAVWHPQLEERDFATAYTPTTDKPITNYIPVLSTAQANEPRFDYDLETKECKGLLIEEQRTNLITYSEDFKANSITLSSVTIEENCNINILGNNNAFKLIGQNVYALARVNMSLLENTTYTFSFHCKNIDATSLKYRVYSNTETKDIIPDTSYLAQVTTDKFSRVTVTFTTTVAGSYGLYLHSGSLAGSAYFCGLQLEEGSFATSYIPTNGSQVTRIGDNTLIDSSNFADIDITNSTILFKGNTFSKDKTSYFFNFNDETETNRIYLVKLASNNYTVCESKLNGVYYNHLNSPSDTEIVALSINKSGTTSSTDVTTLKQVPVVVPKMANLYIGGQYRTSALCGHIKKFAIYPTSISDTELQLMTQG